MWCRIEACAFLIQDGFLCCFFRSTFVVLLAWECWKLALVSFVVYLIAFKEFWWKLKDFQFLKTFDVICLGNYDSITIVSLVLFISNSKMTYEKPSCSFDMIRINYLNWLIAKPSDADVYVLFLSYSEHNLASRTAGVPLFVSGS